MDMKKSSKRFLSLLLTALLLAGVFPVQAAAGENGTTGSPAQTDAVQGDPSEDDAGQDNNTAGADSGSLPGEYPDEEILERPSGPLENSPAPGSGYDEEENSSGSPDGSEDSSADPVKLGLKFEDGAEYVLEPIRSDVSLEQLGIVFRSWGEEQEARYYGKLLEVRGKENDVLGASMRDANGDGIVFGALVEFTLSCEAWRGRSLDELNDMELSLYLTNEYGELGKAQMLFNYWDGHPALFFSAGRLEDLLLTEANDAEKARLAEEREAELAAAAEAETAGEPETAAAETEKIAEGADGTDDDNSIVLEEEYPELTYHETVDGMVVDICAPAGAFPAGMTVAVTSVEEETVLPAVEAALQEAAESSDAVVGTQVLQVRALDITFYNADGTEVQPLLPISVVLCPEEPPQESHDLAVVHIDGEGNGTAVEELERSGDEVSFAAESFSTYVYTSILVTRVLDSEGNNWKVSVSYDSNAGIPENAKLAATEILKDGDSDSTAEYETYLAKTGEALGLETGVFNYVRFFDIKIIDETGDNVTIAAPVDVRIELADRESSNKPRVVHFADGAEIGDVVDSVTLEGTAIQFEAEGFSAYAIADVLEPSRVSDLSMLNEGQAYYLAIDRSGTNYATGTLVSNGSNTELKGTTSVAGATPWYFEPAAGQQFTDGKVYLYRLDGGTKQYLNISISGSVKTISFSETPQELNIEPTINAAGTFYLYTTENGTTNHAFSVRGIRNFFFEQRNNGDNANERLIITEKQGTDPYGLDGKNYGLMNWAGGVAGKAMMSSGSGTALDAKSLTVMTNRTDSTDQLFVPNDSDISMWTFEWIESDQYHLTTVVDGSKQYLRIDENGLSLTDSPDDQCAIQVVPGTGIHAGECFLKSGSTTLTYSGSVASGFSVGGGVGSEWLYPVELSELTPDYFRTYSARKISVCDADQADKIIVYTRSWNKDKLRYDFYAITSDGTLIPVFESGDSIEWVSGQINELLWDFTEYYWEGTSDPNYYYELYNEYSEKYIAPQVTAGQILSDGTIGINLNGRRDGRYYSTILAWDKAYYSYVGLKVEDVGGVRKIVSCPKDEAMDFYFAVMQDLNADDKPTEVPTIDHTPYGITMKIRDIATRAEMSGFLGDNSGTTGSPPKQGLLSSDLGSNGYPIAVITDNNLSALYSGEKTVNHLFIESTYYSSGYFMFDSTQNYAYLPKNKTDFTVYKELGSYDSGGDKNTLKHGQFFPFNNLKPGVFASVNGKNEYGLSGRLPDDDPRKNERLYSIEYDNVKVDPYFAVELEASFTQTPSGLDAWGHDIIFEFTGDDDFWLYVDGELVIDLGGIHSAMPGSVNFRTGDVNVNGKWTTLRKLFEKNYRARNPEASETDVSNFLQKYFDDGSTVFRDNTTHTMRIFYMERGAGASNLQMRFNLSAVKNGIVQLTKELSGLDTPESVLAEFPYQILYRMSEEESAPEYYLKNAIPHSSEQNVDYVFYKDSIKPVKYEQSHTVGGIEYNDVFFLRPGETADINFPEGMKSYRIVECGVNTDVYSTIKVNDAEIAGTSGAGYPQNRKDYGIDYASTGDRPNVKYSNGVNPDALRDLTIQKQLYREDGTTRIHYPDDKTAFTFRLYLATEFGELDAANMHTYHVKDPDGNYCRWDAAAQQFVSLGKTEYSDLTEEEKASASFTTSIYGTIDRIPVDFTVEVRNILAGTQYRVEERPWEVPDGYSFQKYSEYDENYASEVVDSSNHVLGVEGITVSKTASGTEPRVAVNNLKGWGLRMNKTWADADYMAKRDAAYFAVFISGDTGSLSLLEDTVLRLTRTEDPQTLYWYFPRLKDGVAFDRYEIREVKLSNPNPTVDEDGHVTNYGTATPIENNGTISISGRQKGESAPSPYTYTVLYEKGSVSSDSNVRTDTVTDTRPGVILKKTDWAGAALAGAAFTLADAGGSFTADYSSDEEGLITVAFLRTGIPYTLTETIAPQFYQGLPAAMALILNSDGTLSVSGVDSSYYVLEQGSTTASPVLSVKNHPFTFRAVKQDARTENPIAGAKFALHRQVTVGDVTTIDLTPIPGYEELLTGDNGVIPQIDESLPAGTYELKETEAPYRYAGLSSYIQFTVSKTGVITLHGTDSAGRPLSDDVALSCEESDDGTVSYVLSVSNHRLDDLVDITVRKVWDDAENQDGIRPDSIQVQLYRLNESGEWTAVGDPVLLPFEGKWNYTWKDMPVRQGEEEIRYRADEVTVPHGYTAKTEPDGNDYRYIVTNTHVPETVSISVEKVWNDENNKDRIRPAHIQVQLRKNGSAEGDPVTLGKETAWKYTWESLPKNDGGEAITYSVDEVRVPDEYSKTVAGDMSTGFTITNSHTPETVTVSGIKKWEDKDNRDHHRPSAVTVILLADGQQKSKTTTSAGDAWFWRFEALPKYSFTVDPDGRVIKTEITYSVDEVDVLNYKKSITRNSDGTFTITNRLRHSIAPQTGDGTAQWPWMTALLLSAGMLITDSLLRQRKKPQRAPRKLSRH